MNSYFAYVLARGTLASVCASEFCQAQRRGQIIDSSVPLSIERSAAPSLFQRQMESLNGHLGMQIQVLM